MLRKEHCAILHGKLRGIILPHDLAQRALTGSGGLHEVIGVEVPIDVVDVKGPRPEVVCKAVPIDFPDHLVFRAGEIRTLGQQIHQISGPAAQIGVGTGGKLRISAAPVIADIHGAENVEQVDFVPVGHGNKVLSGGGVGLDLPYAGPICLVLLSDVVPEAFVFLTCETGPIAGGIILFGGSAVIQHQFKGVAAAVRVCRRVIRRVLLQADQLLKKRFKRGCVVLFCRIRGAGQGGSVAQRQAQYQQNCENSSESDVPHCIYAPSS